MGGGGGRKSHHENRDVQNATNKIRNIFPVVFNVLKKILRRKEKKMSEIQYGGIESVENFPRF